MKPRRTRRRAPPRAPCAASGRFHLLLLLARSHPRTCQRDPSAGPALRIGPSMRGFPAMTIGYPAGTEFANYISDGWADDAQEDPVGISASLILIAIGAILRFAVTADVQGVNLDTIGVILMIVGAVGALISLLFWSTWGGFRRGEPV
jgi:hypothetical protein